MPPLETCYCPTCYHTNFVTPGQTVWAQVGGRNKIGEARVPPPLDGGAADILETHSCPTCIITTNFVTLGQTVWV